jgi:hypothetical protein
MSQFLTTEHFTLQGARNGTVAEANGRVGHYLSMLGSSVVALAFVADVSELGAAFFTFSIVLFPILIFRGLTTLIRLLQIGIEHFLLAQAINRIRHSYLEVVPEAESYLSFPHHDDLGAVRTTMQPFHSPLQGFASTPGPVILINSVLTGVFASILLIGIVSIRPALAIIIGVLVLSLALALHAWYARIIWERETERQVESRFPTPPD